MAPTRWAWSMRSARTPRTARVGQGAEQHIGRPAPGGVAAFEPVPLDLLARRVVDLDGVAALHPVAGLAVGSEPCRPHLADEARVAERVSETLDLVIEGRGPDVRVVGEPGGDSS